MILGWQVEGLCVQKGDEESLMFVMDIQSLGQVAVKLCQRSSQLEKNSISFNLVARNA